jgi:hypothetical protein
LLLDGCSEAGEIGGCAKTFYARSALMVRLLIRHNVADYKAWRKVYDEFDAERKTLGVTGHAVFQSVDDPNDVTVWHDFATLEKAKSFTTSQRLKDVMGKAGVSSTPQTWYVTEARYIWRKR